MGLVEGITEWLPVSSTGHMILVDEFVKMNVSETFWNMFLVVIQLGAILAVCVLFFYDLNPFSPSKGKEGRRDTWVLWGKIVLGCIPAAAIGLPLNDWMEEHFYNAPVVALALIVYGVLFIVIENWRANKRDQAALAGSFGSRAVVAGGRPAGAVPPGDDGPGGLLRRRGDGPGPAHLQRGGARRPVPALPLPHRHDLRPLPGGAEPLPPGAHRRGGPGPGGPGAGPGPPGPGGGVDPFAPFRRDATYHWYIWP